MSNSARNALVAVLAVMVLAVAGYAFGHHDSTQQATSLWVGDSWAEGVGAGGPEASFACATARSLSWSCSLDAQGGTGYSAVGPHPPKTSPYGRRLAAHKAHVRPDFVVITGGRNDLGVGRQVAEAAAVSYIRAARQAFPKAHLILVAPFWNSSAPPAGLLSLRDTIRVEARRLGATFVDPLAERWFLGPADAPYIFKDGRHLNQAGQEQLATLLTATIQKQLGSKPA